MLVYVHLRSCQDRPDIVELTEEQNPTLPITPCASSDGTLPEAGAEACRCGAASCSQGQFCDAENDACVANCASDASVCDGTVALPAQNQIPCGANGCTASECCLPTCADGSPATADCACGTNTCTSGQFCDTGSNACVANCASDASVCDGTVALPAQNQIPCGANGCTASECCLPTCADGSPATADCACGTNTCTSGQFCDTGSNACVANCASDASVCDGTVALPAQNQIPCGASGCTASECCLPTCADGSPATADCACGTNTCTSGPVLRHREATHASQTVPATHPFVMGPWLSRPRIKFLVAQTGALHQSVAFRPAPMDLQQLRTVPVARTHALQASSATQEATHASQTVPATHPFVMGPWLSRPRIKFLVAQTGALHQSVAFRPAPMDLRQLRTVPVARTHALQASSATQEATHASQTVPATHPFVMGPWLSRPRIKFLVAQTGALHQSVAFRPAPMDLRQLRTVPVARTHALQVRPANLDPVLRHQRLLLTAVSLSLQLETARAAGRHAMRASSVNPAAAPASTRVPPHPRPFAMVRDCSRMPTPFRVM